MSEQATSEHARPAVPRWLAPLRARVHRLPAGVLAWRIGVAVLGGLVVVLGLVLVPLPGPGWLIVFLGLAVWATEFVWAQRLLRWGRSILARWTDWAKAQPRWLQLIIGVVGLAFLAGVALFAWWLVH